MRHVFNKGNRSVPNGTLRVIQMLQPILEVERKKVRQRAPVPTIVNHRSLQSHRASRQDPPGIMEKRSVTT